MVAGSRVEAGQTTSVRVSCDSRLFRHWEEAENTWKPLNDGELIIAHELGDVRARLPLS